MRSEDTDTAVLQLRCIRTIEQLDEQGLQLIAGLLERISVPASTPRKRAARGERARNTTSEKESAT